MSRLKKILSRHRRSHKKTRKKTMRTKSRRKNMSLFMRVMRRYTFLSSFVPYFRKTMISLSVIAFVVWVITIANVSGSTGYAYQRIKDKSLEISSNMGFKVEDIIVIGRYYTDPDVLLRLADIKKGDPIFSFDLNQARENIEKISWVENVHVVRRLPNVIVIDLYERRPVALWQHNKKLTVIDAMGHKLTDNILAEFKKLPIIVGRDAPKHASELMVLLEREPIIAEMLNAAVRVGGRRWDLHLNNNIKVKLPEINVEQALSKLAHRHYEQDILNKDIQFIDLRLPDRLVIKVNPDHAGKAQQISLKRNHSI